MDLVIMMLFALCVGILGPIGCALLARSGEAHAAKQTVICNPRTGRCREK
jgi:hypothetical protein